MILRIGSLFTPDKNGYGGAISVTEQTCAVPISKLESQISNRCPHYLTESFSRRQEKLPGLEEA